ncbi:MAG: hypothetical protein LBO09_01785 [Candidatus Peribacteria bacterium]|jgi:hypothetical protein|nr:hypothetical protein [Candidatus Peribacteria bacterium]
MKLFKTFLIVTSLFLSSISVLSFANNLSVRNLFGAHIEVGLGERNFTPSADPEVANVLELQKALKNQLSFPLIDQLDVATNEVARSVVLVNYLTASHKLLQITQTAIESESALAESYQTLGKTCEEPIAGLNKEFTTAVQNYEYEGAHALSLQIAKLRACVAENAVYYKEHLLYSDGLKSLQIALQKRVEYVETHQDNIVRYYDLLKPQLLKELYTISQTLEGNF